MKRILALVLVVLMAASTLWGCQKSETQTTLVPGLSDEEAYNIQLAFFDWEGTIFEDVWIPWFYEGYGFGLFYLGSAEGYDFIYWDANGGASMEPNLAEDGADSGEQKLVGSLWIGEIEFYDVSDSALWAHKDGKIYRTKDLYDDGLISVDTVILIKEEFEKCYEEQESVSIVEYNRGMDRFMEDYPWDYDPREDKE